MKKVVFFSCVLLTGLSLIKAGPFDSLSLKVTSAIGGIGSKKENEQFIKYRNSPVYSGYFAGAITSSQEFKAVYDMSVSFLKQWTPMNISTLNIQVSDLNAKQEQPILFARMYDLISYLVNSGAVPLDPKVKEFMKNEILSGTEKINGNLVINKRCSPKYPSGAEKEIKDGTIKFKEYLFLTAECSKKIMDALKSQEANINSFLGYAVVSKPVDPNEIQALQVKERTPIGSLREKCKNAATITPDCAGIVASILYSTQARPLIGMQYGNGYLSAQTSLTPELKQKLTTCARKETFNPMTCGALISEVISAWDEVDVDHDSDLYPNPLSYLAEHSPVLELALTAEDFRRQVLFENYESYKNIDAVFGDVYAMACTFDPSYRLRVSPLARATFLEQELAFSSTGILKAAKENLQKIQSLSQSDSLLLSKVGKAASENLTVKSDENKLLPPVSIYRYIKNWDHLSKVMIKDKSASDLLMGENSVQKNILAEHNANIEIDYSAIYAIISKICISVLGPEYLKAESDITKALETQDRQSFDQTLKNVSAEINQPQSTAASTKDSRAFRYLPSNEYNKLRQVCLVMLTNIHVLLLDEKDQLRGKKGSFSIVADQIRLALPKQLAFFSLYLFALKEKKYDASDLSTSSFANIFAEYFLMPIYPLVQDENMPNQATLIDAMGTNMYSLYSSYLLGSIQGVVDTTNTVNMVLDNRSQKNRLVGNFSQQYGAEAGVSLEYTVQGAVKAALDILPVPKPPIITSAVVSGITTLLISGPQWAYKALKNTCRFNKDKCVSKTVKNVNLTRPLDVRLTEFLMAIEISLGAYLKSQNLPQGNDPVALRRLMPTLYILERDDKTFQQQQVNTPVGNVKELINQLIQNTKAYYDSLSTPVTGELSNMVTNDINTGVQTP